MKLGDGICVIVCLMLINSQVGGNESDRHSNDDDDDDVIEHHHQHQHQQQQQQPTISRQQWINRERLSLILSSRLTKTP